MQKLKHSNNIETKEVYKDELNEIVYEKNKNRN